MALAVIALLAAFTPASAQNGTMTPYSRFGYGILSDHATSAQRSMGGVGYAMSNGRQINVMNPASYAAVDSLTFLFDIGMDITGLWSTEAQAGGVKASGHDFGGGLDYVTMQFPLCRFMGASIGLVPYSSVGYSFGSEIDNGIASRQGFGSLNEFYVGLGARLFKGFTIGANVSYFFGTIISDSYANTGSHSSLFEKEFTVRDWHIDLGAQYSFNINPANRLTLGLVFSPGKTLLGSARTYAYDPSKDQAPTVEDEQNLKDNYTLPSSWGAGISYQLGRKLTLEADFTYQPWSKAKYTGFESDEVTNVFADRTKYALGLQYVPNFRGSYFRRVQYRLGGYYNRDYLIVKGNNVREYGISAGFGFPVPTFKTIINLGLEWKHRQATPVALIKENYLNITIGVNFNEMWFRKSKIY